jgi:ribosomal protein L11 methylase PrmA
MTITQRCATISASFRDPSGFIFKHEGELYRQVNRIYGDHYQMLMDSGLYDYLVSQGMLVPHEEVDGPVADENSVWRILKPEPIPLISYPYEWCFSQLKDAALLTLDIQRIAVEHGMCLKDASAYNVQFHHGRPVFIDTLSFEPYAEGEPWVAYRQFCQHFLAPLALMAKRDVRLGQLLRVHIDGLPLDLASALLPRRTWLPSGLMMHLHLHARTQKAFAASDKAPSETTKRLSRVSRNGLIGIIEGLRKTITKLDWKPGGTEWGDYYNDTNYSDSSFEIKRRLIVTFLDEIDPAEVWDLGANIGLFSRITSDQGLSTVAFDIDPSAVEINYRQVRKQNESSLLPLLLDLTNPSPGLGWNSTERDALSDRGPVDCIMALALIHHLSISNNVPFGRVAAFFAGLCCRSLIIEFVPKSDSQVQRLLRSRQDVFSDYDRENFEKAFTEFFSILRAEPIEGSERILYLMQKRPV